MTTLHNRRSWLVALVTIAVLHAPGRSWAETPSEPAPEEITNLDESQPLPPGYTPVLRRRKGLIIGGLITFGAAYNLSVLYATGDSFDANGEPINRDVGAVLIPVAGPFLQMFKEDETGLKVGMAVLGSAQVIGVALMVAGLISKKRVLVRNDLVGSMTLSPMAGGATGAVLSGRF